MVFTSQKIWLSQSFPSLQLVNETRAIAIAKAGTQANQFASAIDHAGSKTNFYRKSHRQKFCFFSRLKRDLLLNFCIWHIRKSYIRKHPIRENNTYVLKALKTNCYWHVHFSSICVKLVNIKNNNFEHVL